MATGAETYVLVTGAAGILGLALTDELDRRPGFAVYGADIGDFDITDARATTEFIGAARPNVVINCAAFTRVDACESATAACFAANGRGAANIARAAAAVGARSIQLSTDYIFDGRAGRAYREDDEPAPLNAYGRSKLEGERLARAAAPDCLIVRTAWLFGVGGANFVAKILARARGGETLRVVDDQRGSPTFAGHLAAGIADLLTIPYRGVIHCAGAGVASWFDVAAQVLRLAALEAPLVAIKTADFAQPARRPVYSALDCSRFEALTGGRLPDWREGVRAYLRETGDLAADA